MGSRILLLLLGLFVLTGNALAQSCSVPYTLTNGTTADASQVMSNFNALTTCVSGASAAGSFTTLTTSGAATLGSTLTISGGDVTVSGTNRYVTLPGNGSTSIGGFKYDTPIYGSDTGATLGALGGGVNALVSGNSAFTIKTGATRAAATTIGVFSNSGLAITGNLSVSSGTTANQLRTAQTTAPTCSSNCGTSPSVAGTDTAGIVTMGASGTPASGWVVSFNGTWASAPACIVQASKSGMAAGKAPIVVVATTSSLTVTTNGTAPANSDTYAYHCIGVS